MIEDDCDRIYTPPKRRLGLDPPVYTLRHLAWALLALSILCGFAALLLK